MPLPDLPTITPSCAMRRDMANSGGGRLRVVGAGDGGGRAVRVGRGHVHYAGRVAVFPLHFLLSSVTHLLQHTCRGTISASFSTTVSYSSANRFFCATRNRFSTSGFFERIVFGVVLDRDQAMPAAPSIAPGPTPLLHATNPTDRLPAPRRALHLDDDDSSPSMSELAST